MQRACQPFIYVSFVTGLLWRMARLSWVRVGVSRDIVEELHVSSAVEIPLELAGELTGHLGLRRLAEVISNLVGNAIDPRAPGTPIVVTCGKPRGGSSSSRERGRRRLPRAA